MQIGKNFFPIGRGFTAVETMKTRFDTLQGQLATGKKAETLSELGRDRIYDLTVRARQGRLEAFQSNVSIVNLRLDFFDTTLARLDEIEADARSMAMSGGVGADSLNMVSAQSLSLARLDEVVNNLRTEVNGRYLFGGGQTDAPPIPTIDAILNGTNGRDGFRTLVAERQLADAGADGRGRLVNDTAALTSSLPVADTVRLSEAVAGTSPYRPEVTGVSTTAAPLDIAVSGPTGAPTAIDVQFAGVVAPGDQVTINVSYPDGTNAAHVFTAVAGPPTTPGEFEIGGSAAATATNFQAAVDGVIQADSVTLREDGIHNFGMKLNALTSSTTAISTALTPAAATPGVNSFTYAADALAYGVGDTTTFEISVDGGAPVTVTINQAEVNGVGDFDDVIDDINEMQAVLTAALATAGVTGVTVGNDGTNITLTSNTPGATSNVTISNVLGNADAGGNANTGSGLVDGAGTTGTALGAYDHLAIRFAAQPANNSTVSLTVDLPDGKTHTITLTAKTNPSGTPGEFQIGATRADTAANFNAAFLTEIERTAGTQLRVASTYWASDNFFTGQGETTMRVDGPPATATGLVAATSFDTVDWYTGEDDTDPRRTVQARVDEGTTVSYGVQANESGFLELMRSLAAMAVEHFNPSDTTAVKRYQGMITEQTARLAETNNGTPGSIEVITLELGVVRASVGLADERHVIQEAQLDSILSDIEGVSIEEVAAEILSLRTRLEASYQTMTIVSQLSLVNYVGR